MFETQERRRAFLRGLFDAAVAAAHPVEFLPAHVPSPVRGRTVVAGAGKASAAMAAAFEKEWMRQGNGPLEGTVVVPYGYPAECEHIQVIFASHPVPDQGSADAAEALLRLARSLGPDDQLVALISGGGSSLLAAPPPGVTLAEKQALGAALLRSGATIQEINTVRRAVSQIKGGQLAKAAHPARVLTLVLSDVPGDNPADIASGPTIQGSREIRDAQSVLDRYGIEIPACMKDWLSGRPDEPAENGGQSHEVRLVASAQQSLEAAALHARSQGVTAHVLSDRIEGEASVVGKVHAAIAKQILLQNEPFSAPCVLLSGGETTVTVRSRGGKGGRNTEFLLALALEIDGMPGIECLAADTDGIDGSESNAGAFCGSETVNYLAREGLSARSLLERNNAWTAFKTIGDLLMTGPTQTNVNDFRAILIVPGFN